MHDKLNKHGPLKWHKENESLQVGTSPLRIKRGKKYERNDCTSKHQLIYKLNRILNTIATRQKMSTRMWCDHGGGIHAYTVAVTFRSKSRTQNIRYSPPLFICSRFEKGITLKCFNSIYEKTARCCSSFFSAISICTSVFFFFFPR